MSSADRIRRGAAQRLAILLIGMIAMAFDGDIGETILTAGMAVVIFTPLLSIFVSAIALYIEKDRYWLMWVIIVIVISLIGLYVSFNFK